MKFKKGDKVRVVGDFGNYHGKIFIVESLMYGKVDGKNMYLTHTEEYPDNRDRYFWYENELELVKPKFDYRRYMGKYAIHCPTKAAADIFREYMNNRHGKEYARYVSSYYPDDHGICYNLSNNRHCDIEYYLEEGYAILEFDDFDWSEDAVKELTVEEKRKRLREYCNTRTCGGCLLEGPVCRCGRGSSFHPSGIMPENEVLAAYEIVFGGNEMKKFTKKDLKNGDVVKFRDGCPDTTGIVCVDTGTIICSPGRVGLDSYNDDLTCKPGYMKDYDIMAVRRPIRYKDCHFDAFKFECGELIFERKEVEEMTLEEVCKALGKEVKIVKKK